MRGGWGWDYAHVTTAWSEHCQAAESVKISCEMMWRVNILNATSYNVRGISHQVYTITRDHGKKDEILLVKTGECIVFCVYRES